MVTTGRLKRSAESANRRSGAAGASGIPRSSVGVTNSPTRPFRRYQSSRRPIADKAELRDPAHASPWRESRRTVRSAPQDPGLQMQARLTSPRRRQPLELALPLEQRSAVQWSAPAVDRQHRGRQRIGRPRPNGQIDRRLVRAIGMAMMITTRAPASVDPAAILIPHRSGPVSGMRRARTARIMAPLLVMMM